MKHLLFLYLGVVSSFASDTRPLKERVNEFCQKHRSIAEIEKRHAEWIKQEPDNPDAYILPANALAKAAETVNIVAGDQKDAIAVLTDPKTGKQVGSIAEGPDPAIIKRAEDILKAATKKFPQRLDIHVGRMAMSQRIKDTEAVTTAALDLLATAAKDPQTLRWIDNEQIDGVPLKKALEEVEARIRWLYSFEKDETDKFAQDCALKALELAPGNVELLNFAAIRHLYRGEWKEGREYLLRAEIAAPRDWIVQHNIARASAELGDKADALKRLQAVIKAVPGTDDAKAAEASIKSLGLDVPK
ncbi:MAG: tetratricopeptide repeat protein [Prosthecobacter sp.]|uniref:tetratricopeptide repeat protein n=1 Tax=Prosthecobacter sp. TaxID=1965333 RepID=UPI00390411E3